MGLESEIDASWQQCVRLFLLLWQLPPLETNPAGVEFR